MFMTCSLKIRSSADHNDLRIAGLRSRTRFASACLLLTLALPTLGGCFNAEGLIESRRLTAIRAKLQEVDLGNFRISIPQGQSYGQTTELQFHVFGQVANRDMEAVAEVLEEYGPVIRDQMLVSVRELRPEELEEPRLTSLRESIAQVINGFLEEEPVQSVGFHQFRYIIF